MTEDLFKDDLLMSLLNQRINAERKTDAQLIKLMYIVSNYSFDINKININNYKCNIQYLKSFSKEIKNITGTYVYITKNEYLFGKDATNYGNGYLTDDSKFIVCYNLSNKQLLIKFIEMLNDLRNIIKLNIKMIVTKYSSKINIFPREDYVCSDILCTLVENINNIPNLLN